jgi:hypothetical protein
LLQKKEIGLFKKHLRFLEAPYNRESITAKTANARRPKTEELRTKCPESLLLACGYVCQTFWRMPGRAQLRDDSGVLGVLARNREVEPQPHEAGVCSIEVCLVGITPGLPQTLNQVPGLSAMGTTDSMSKHFPRGGADLYLQPEYYSIFLAINHPTPTKCRCAFA